MAERTRRVTTAEFHAELKAQGVPREHAAVKCFMCDTVQSLTSFIRAGVDPERAEGRIAFSCVGRVRAALPPHKAKGRNEGCDWSLGGLFSFSDFIVVTEDGNELPAFPPSTADEARALMAVNTPAEVANA